MEYSRLDGIRLLLGRMGVGFILLRGEGKGAVGSVFIASAVEEKVVGQVQNTQTDFDGGRDEYAPYLGSFLQQTETHPKNGCVRV